MQETFTINAKARSDTGKGASRRLRRTGYLPGILYGGGDDKQPTTISVKHSELLQHLEHEAFYSHVLTLDLDGAPEKVVLKDLQRHPAKPFVLHCDFLRINPNDKIRMHVPLHFVNDDKAPGVKRGGRVIHTMTDLEITCLPKDLPEFIEVNVGTMDIGDSFHLSALQLPEGVSLYGEMVEETTLVTIVGAGPALDTEEQGEEG
jgi:large subunit ribosomal protein L25